MVASILIGENLRTLTEGLTQRRVLLMNASIIVTYLKALSSIQNFNDVMTSMISTELNESKNAKTKNKKKLSPDEKQYLCWFLGLTLKSIDNVTRDDTGLKDYIDDLDQNLKETADVIETQFGPISVDITYQNKKNTLEWSSLIRCMLAIGAQTLAIRGSEKSIYGKLFEKFVLGSVISILGGTYINKHDVTKKHNVFWLSDREDTKHEKGKEERRESDATFLLEPGVGFSFDIGFIGKGNPEISMDKMTRFDHLYKRGSDKHQMTTIILIDKIGENSRAKNLASRISGYLIQMSGTYWVKELAKDIHETAPSFNNQLLHITDEESIQYIKNEVAKIDMSVFLSAAK